MEKRQNVIALLNNINTNISTGNYLKTKQPILITVSGGQDSICLFFIFIQLKKQWDWAFGIIYCNHLWQKNSFFSGSLILKIAYLFSVSIYYVTTTDKIFSEQNARKWRYTIFFRLGWFYDYTIVSNGHTESDKIETILFQFIRGGSLKSLLPLKTVKHFASNSKFIKNAHVNNTFIYLKKRITFFPIGKAVRKKNVVFFTLKKWHQPLRKNPPFGGVHTDPKFSALHKTTVGRPRPPGLPRRGRQGGGLTDPWRSHSIEASLLGAIRGHSGPFGGSKIKKKTSFFYLSRDYTDRKSVLQPEKPKVFITASTQKNISDFSSEASSQKLRTYLSDFSYCFSKSRYDFLPRGHGGVFNSHLPFRGCLSQEAALLALSFMQSIKSKSGDLLFGLEREKLEQKGVGFKFYAKHKTKISRPPSLLRRGRQRGGLTDPSQGSSQFLRTLVLAKVNDVPKWKRTQQSQQSFFKNPLANIIFFSLKNQKDCPKFILKKKFVTKLFFRQKKYYFYLGFHKNYLNILLINTFKQTKKKRSNADHQKQVSKGVDNKKLFVQSRLTGRKIFNFSPTSQNMHFLMRPITVSSRFEVKKLVQYFVLPIYPDASNKKKNYYRNRVRSELIPTLRFFFNPQIHRSFFQFSDILLNEQFYLNLLCKQLIPELYIFRKKQFLLNITLFQNLPRAVQTKLVQMLVKDCTKTQPNFSNIVEITKLIKKPRSFHKPISIRSYRKNYFALDPALSRKSFVFLRSKRKNWSRRRILFSAGKFS